MGAFSATGLEIAGMKYGTALQRQASETRIEGQYQSEQARAIAIKDASNLTGRAQQILGLQSAAASRSQSLGAIAGGYTMSVQMANAQRTASLGMIEQGRRQQVTGLLADRNFGEQQTNISMRREENDSRVNQAERNISTLTNRTTDALEHGVGAGAALGGKSLPLLSAVRDATQVVIAPARAINEISINNTATDARIGNLNSARRDHVENYEFTGQMRLDAADQYVKESSKITDSQASANIAAARANRDLAAGGVERGYRQQVHGVNSAYQLNLEANQVNFAGTLKAAEVMKSSGLQAVKLEQVSQIVTTLSRDLARRA